MLEPKGSGSFSHDLTLPSVDKLGQNSGADKADKKRARINRIKTGAGIWKNPGCGTGRSPVAPGLATSPLARSRANSRNNLAGTPSVYLSDRSSGESESASAQPLGSAIALLGTLPAPSSKTSQQAQPTTGRLLQARTRCQCTGGRGQ